MDADRFTRRRAYSRPFSPAENGGLESLVTSFNIISRVTK
jgi:hypothetical protein